MENASKALIIAGAILLSILIIGIGMFIYNQAKEQIDNSAGQMSQEEIRVHNSQFEIYKGDRVSGSQVKQLLTKLATNAAKFDAGSTDERKPEIEVEGLSNKNNYSPNDINSVKITSTKTYTVEMNLNNNSLINKITIKENKPGSEPNQNKPAGKK